MSSVNEGLRQQAAEWLSSAPPLPLSSSPSSWWWPEGLCRPVPPVMALGNCSLCGGTGKGMVWG